MIEIDYQVKCFWKVPVKVSILSTSGYVEEHKKGILSKMTASEMRDCILDLQRQLKTADKALASRTHANG